MATGLVPYRPLGPQQKPPAGSRLNRASGLARDLAWLVAPGGAQVSDYVDGGAGILLPNGTWAGATRHGAALRSTSDTDGGAYWPPPSGLARLDATSPHYSLLLWLSLTSFPQGSSLFRFSFDFTGSYGPLDLVFNPFAGLLTARWTGGFFSDRTVDLCNISVLPTDGTLTCLLVTRAGTDWAVYRNGVLFATATAGTDGVLQPEQATATSVLCYDIIGSQPGVTGQLPLGAFWTRTLLAGEAAALAAQPYALLDPPGPAPGQWYVSVGGGGVTGTGAITIRHPALSGSGTTTVTGTGAVLIHHPTLAATGTTTVTSTGALTIRHPLLSGTGAFVNATGALTIRHPALSATGSTTVTGAGALSISHPTLAASGAQGPAATGVLAIRHPVLAASGTTTVIGTGALTVRHPVLAATGTTTVTGTGSVTISHPTLLGAAPGTVTGSGTLTVHHPTLAGTGTTTITGTGALTIRHPVLAASGTTTVTGTGSLTIRHPLLSGAAPTTITGTGALTVRHPVLAASGTTTVVGSGALTIRHPVLAGSDQAARNITITAGGLTTGWAARGLEVGWVAGGVTR